MSFESTTSAASSDPTVDIWIIDLNSPGLSAAFADSLLSADERARADAFRSDAARRRHLFARAALRLVLAERLGAIPQTLEFGVGPHGKPALSGLFAGRLHFNLTHSADLACVAVSGGTEVGIDVAQLRPVPGALALARRFFTPPESAALAALPAREQSSAFLNLWTRKEALAKATGQGIFQSLARFEVSCETAAVIQAVDGDPAAARQWTLHAFTPASGYIAALAARHPAAAFTLRHSISAF